MKIQMTAEPLFRAAVINFALTKLNLLTTIKLKEALDNLPKAITSNSRIDSKRLADIVIQSFILLKSTTGMESLISSNNMTVELAP